MSQQKREWLSRSKSATIFFPPFKLIKGYPLNSNAVLQNVLFLSLFQNADLRFNMCQLRRPGSGAFGVTNIATASVKASYHQSFEIFVIRQLPRTAEKCEKLWRLCLLFSCLSHLSHFCGTFDHFPQLLDFRSPLSDVLAPEEWLTRASEVLAPRPSLPPSLFWRGRWKTLQVMKLCVRHLTTHLLSNAHRQVEVIESNLVTCCICFFCQGSDRHPNSHGCGTQFVSPSDFRWRRQFFQPVRHRRPQAQQAPLQQMQMFGYRLNDLYCLDSFKIQAGATSGSSREGGRQSQIVRVVWNGLVATVLLLKFGLL